MQVAKDQIRQNILDTARKEFLDRGFKNTSMRIISKKSSVGLGNLYNYFTSKDELFVAVLTPFLTVFEKTMDEHNSEEKMTIDVLTSREYQLDTIHAFLKIIARFRKELKILFFGAEGSCLETYKERFIEKNTEIGLEYVEQMKQAYPTINSNVSPFFIRIASIWWVTFLAEIASHENMTEKEIEHFISDFICFGTEGWKALMQIKNANG